MSVLCTLTQISFYLLNRIQEIPSVFDLFWSVESIDSEDKIDNIDGLSSEYTYLLHEILNKPEQAVGILTLWDIQEIENWRVEYKEDFKVIKSEIYQIVMEGKTTPILDLGKSWYALGYIFRASYGNTDNISLIDSATSGEIKVEVIFGGENIQDLDIRYLKSTEVKIIADALAQISDETIQNRFQQMQGDKSSNYGYGYGWSDKNYKELLKVCNEVKDFYQDAANKGNGILINLG